MQMAFNVRRQAMQQRLALCAQPGAECPPLTWTISNRLAEFAPFLLQWYYRWSSATGTTVPAHCMPWSGIQPLCDGLSAQ